MFGTVFDTFCPDAQGRAGTVAGPLSVPACRGVSSLLLLHAQRSFGDCSIWSFRTSALCFNP
jgi:hypothetical protein